MQRVIATNGLKSSRVQDSWDFVDVFGSGNMVDSELYARVAAAFRAFNLKANTVGNMPFALVDKSGNDIDTSATWENKVGFLPNPSELLRLNTLSYMETNTVYALRTSNVLGERTKGLYHAVPTEFTPVLNGQATDVDHIERRVGALLERYQYPDDKRLVRMWRFDHTTDLLPSKNTEAKAIMNAAGVLYYADTWIKHYYQGGGIKPTLVAMKGLVDPSTKEEKEKSWWNWLLGLGKNAFRKVKIYNAETVDVKAFGDGVGDLKDNKVYDQALANIAMGTGMPLSLLMANSANYATAKEEKATWYENDIIPLCNWMAYEYNRQVFEPLGLFLEFRPETLDPQQEDETARATAYKIYIDAGMKPSVAAQMLGLELPDGVEYEELDKMKEEKDQQAMDLQREQFAARAGEKPKEDEPKQKPSKEEEKDDDEEEKKPAKWIPSLDEFKELDWYKTLAFRKLKRGEALTFDYIPRHGGLPEVVLWQIKTALAVARTEDDIRSAFEIEEKEPVQETKADPGLLALAEALNRHADATFEQLKTQKAPSPSFNISMPAITLTTQMPEQGSVIVQVPEQPAPVVNVTNQVEPTPVQVNNDVTVKPAPVQVVERGKREAKIKYDRDGKVIGITSDEA